MVDDIIEEATASSILSAAREAKGMTQKEVADRLFLTTAFIRHIDNNEIEKIPKQAFVRGYLRSYGKLVDVDGDRAVQMFEAQSGVQPHRIDIKPLSRDSMGSKSFTGPVLATGIVGLVGLALVIGLVWYLSADEEPVSEASVPVAALIETDVAVTDSADDMGLEDNAENFVQEQADSETLTDEEIALAAANIIKSDEVSDTDVASVVGENSDDSTEALVEEAVANNAEDDAAPEEALVVIDPETEPVVTAEQEASPARKEIVFSRSTDGDVSVVNIDAEGSDSVSFEFSDDCWLEVRDADNQFIYGDLGKAKQRIDINGVAPYKIVIGKATVVTMRFRDAAYDLQPHITSRKTATFTLGK